MRLGRRTGEDEGGPRRARFGLRRAAAGAVAVGVLGLAVAGGAVWADWLSLAFRPSSSIPHSAEGDFALMAEAWNTIDRVYVDREAVKPRQLAYGSIAGMVDALGDTGHSTFLTPEMRKQSRQELKGELEGIGAEIRMKDGQVVVVTPLDGSPAQKAGLRPGDVITQVDGKDIAGLPLPVVVGRILGPPGTTVTLTLLDPSSGITRRQKIVRAHITLQNVTWHVLPGARIAHLRIANFSEGVTSDLQEALRQIREEGLRALILDLRNDPGGIFDEAIGVASQFLAGGDVLQVKDAKGRIRPVPVRPGGLGTSVPAVLLVNHGTASAAEIVAGALQDPHRAKLVGQTTFGTGTVLGEFPLSDGSALLLATQEWLTPDGRTIWHRGIQPDVPVSLPPDILPVFPRAERGMSAEELRKSGDRQLLEAAELLGPSEPGKPAP